MRILPTSLECSRTIDVRPPVLNSHGLSIHLRVYDLFLLIHVCIPESCQTHRHSNEKYIWVQRFFLMLGKSKKARTRSSTLVTRRCYNLKVTPGKVQLLPGINLT